MNEGGAHKVGTQPPDRPFDFQLIWQNSQGSYKNGFDYLPCQLHCVFKREVYFIFRYFPWMDPFCVSAVFLVHGVVHLLRVVNGLACFFWILINLFLCKRLHCVHCLSVETVLHVNNIIHV